MTRVYTQSIRGLSSSPLLPVPVTSLQTNVTTVGHSGTVNSLEVPGRSNFAATAQKCCGIFQVCLGTIAVVLGGAAWGVQDGLITYVFSCGFVAGGFLVIGGSLAIYSTRTERTSIIVACLVMSVFSAFVDFLYLCISCASLWFDFTPEMDILEADGPIGIIDVFGALVGLVGLVIAIIQVVICSRTVCGCCAKDTVLVVVTSEEDPSSPTLITPLLSSLNCSINTSTDRQGYGSQQRLHSSLVV